MFGGSRLPAVLAALLVAAAAGSAGAVAQPAQHVTMIGDSVADALQLDPAATDIVEKGVDMDLELAACRRLGAESCPDQNGFRPPTALELIQQMGASLGANVVMAVGYNDDETAYAGEIDAALSALQAAGVQHVLWLTLRQVRHPYVTMDDAILAAAAGHPALMTVVDWDAYSRGHDDWFAPDGIHLANAGAEAMAQLVHAALLDAGIAAEPIVPTPPPVAHVKVATFKLPVALERKAYAAKLTASGGRAPYHWSSTKLPPGLLLRNDGSLSGRPHARAGAYRLSFRVVDAAGKSARRSLTLRLR